MEQKGLDIVRRDWCPLSKVSRRAGARVLLPWRKHMRCTLSGLAFNLTTECSANLHGHLIRTQFKFP